MQPGTRPGPTRGGKSRQTVAGTPCGDSALITRDPDPSGILELDSGYETAIDSLAGLLAPFGMLIARPGEGFDGAVSPGDVEAAELAVVLGRRSIS